MLDICTGVEGLVFLVVDGSEFIAECAQRQRLHAIGQVIELEVQGAAPSWGAHFVDVHADGRLAFAIELLQEIAEFGGRATALFDPRGGLIDSSSRSPAQSSAASGAQMMLRSPTVHRP